MPEAAGKCCGWSQRRMAFLATLLLRKAFLRLPRPCIAMAPVQLDGWMGLFVRLSPPFPPPTPEGRRLCKPKRQRGQTSLERHGTFGGAEVVTAGSQHSSSCAKTFALLQHIISPNRIPDRRWGAGQPKLPRSAAEAKSPNCL